MKFLYFFNILVLMETNKTTEVVFSGKGLVEIPPNLPRDTEVLWMNDNAV